MKVSINTNSTNIGKQRVAAGIVVYNPNIQRLQECILHLKKQVGCIIVYDNSDSNNVFDPEIIYLTNNKNDGVAYALNKIFEKANMMGYEWVLTMDQDTIVPENMISIFSKYMNRNDIGIICPQVIDKRRKYLQIDNNPNDVSFVESCITSASCTNLSAWIRLGGFDEFLFIDFVDNDYCKRLILNGYKILRCNNVLIDQEFGNIQLRSPFCVKFYIGLSHLLKNKNIAKLSYHKEVSPVRVYYVHRNLLYLNKKFKDYGGIGYDNFYCHSFAGFLLYFSLPSLVRGSKKIKILKAIAKGLYDGWKAKKRTIIFKPNA